jgi:hypothetical protein
MLLCAVGVKNYVVLVAIEVYFSYQNFRFTFSKYKKQVCILNFFPVIRIAISVNVLGISSWETYKMLASATFEDRVCPEEA